MRLLTDRPDALRGWSDSCGWERAPATGGSSAEADLWTALGGRGVPWLGRADARVVASAAFWELLVVVERTPASQFQVLRRRLGGDMPRPVACLALQGGPFKGQHGREWMAAAGNIHLSVALDTPGLPAKDAAALAMLPAVALVEAITRASAGALRPGIKWVNDVVLAGQKVGGVLAATQVTGDRVLRAVLGMGLNVATTPAVPATAFVPAVSSLAAAGANLALPDVLGAILDSLARRVGELLTQGLEPLYLAYHRASVVLGREVAVWDDPPGAALDPARTPPRARGIVRGIGRDLGLRLDDRADPVTQGRLAFPQDVHSHR